MTTVVGGSSVRQVLDDLCAVQAIDDEARGFKLERAELRQKLERLKELLGLMTQGLEEKQAKLAEASRWYRDKSSELKGDQEKVARKKNELQRVTKNREYLAMQREIETLRKANLSREEEIEKLQGATEAFQASITEEQAKIAELTHELKAEEASNATRIAELDQRIDAISSRKGAVTKRLPPAILSRYNRIAKKREGVAIVPVRNHACTGCNYAVTPQQLIIIQRGEQIIDCRNCSRFLYWDGDPEEPETDLDEDAAVEADQPHGG